MGGRAQQARGLPGGVLGFQEAVELLIRDLEAEVAETFPHEARILDLLDRARHPEERCVAFPEVSGEGILVRQTVPPDGCEAGPMASVEQGFVVDELHERVAPIEEDRLQHGGVGYSGRGATTPVGLPGPGAARNLPSLHRRRRRRHALRLLGARARAARMAHRRGDRARCRAHGGRRRRLSQRLVRECAGADHRAVRRCGRASERRPWLHHRQHRVQPPARARARRAARRRTAAGPALAPRAAQPRARRLRAPARRLGTRLARSSRSARACRRHHSGGHRAAGPLRARHHAQSAAPSPPARRVGARRDPGLGSAAGSHRARGRHASPLL